jgi:hypothetical protein
MHLGHRLSTFIGHAPLGASLQPLTIQGSKFPNISRLILYSTAYLVAKDRKFGLVTLPYAFETSVLQCRI